ncbi:MAG TPA: double-strand break repair protein AddB [Allosphingosinicella sp.]|nr:double-strand break repair protein AddB [Allosphingosinicella sp.]
MTPNVYTIPPHRAFADALAAGLLALHGKEKTGLARGVVLVPNQRAARAVQDAFVRRAGGGLLLPRLVPIGDAELDERLNGALDPLDADVPIPAAIDPAERLMLLARIVQEQSDVDAPEALRLAADLARTLDQLLVEEVEPTRLNKFVADLPDLSIHWQRSLDKLRLILDQWPAILVSRGAIDLADRRNRLLSALARRWQKRPPEGFVCAAGINLTAPAVACLLGTVSRLANGMVVLPALDLHLPDAQWQALGAARDDHETSRRRPIETHPQFHLKLLLDRMSVARGEVRLWRWGGGRDSPAVRSRAIAHAMAPAQFTDLWQTLPPRQRRLSGVRALELADPAEEAQAIALALREALEEPGRTAALVTPDRNLARRVSAHLMRWGIEADDSAGRPLSQTAPGTLILAIAAAAAERFAPVPLLALLKHPLVMAGENRLAWLDGVRLLDLSLRGPRPPAGLKGVEAYLADRSGRDARIRAQAAAWWTKASALLRPIEAAFEGVADLQSLLANIREACMRLAGDGMWSGPAGRSAGEWFEAQEEAAREGPRLMSQAGLPELLEQLMAKQAVRPPYGQHPRIFIWGLIEARLQQADLMILGGLNEGVWPALPAPDPWLAPRLRSDLGLPSLERRIGLSAHDFACALGAPRVLVTRARRDSRAEAIASRFWLRLEALTGGLSRAPQLRKWARDIDRPAGPARPASRPAPAPAAAERPRNISVTEVDRLKADPFAFYARKMLRLAALDQVDADPSPAWRGTAVHSVLEAWMKEDDCDPSKLRPRAEALLAGSSAHPLMRALWQPRLIEAIDFIAAEVERNRLAGRLPLKAEAWGTTEIAGVSLGGKADRIDRFDDGRLAIVDYKTGSPPSAKAVADGYSLQLGLLGLIAERHGFDGIEGEAACFEYWSLARKAGKLGFVGSPVGGRNGLDAAEFTNLAERNFVAAAEKWLTGDEPFTAKLHPEYAPYAEFDQLMRLDEWYGREG